MGSKSSGKTYTSRGAHSNVASSTLKGIKRDRDPSEKIINVQRAWLKGQNPWVNIPNPNKEEKNRPTIRVKANVLWGNPKDRLKKTSPM